jgi:hypothetical protein
VASDAGIHAPSLWDLYGAEDLLYRKFMPGGQRMPSMKTPSQLIPRATRWFGLIALVVLFLLSVFELAHQPAASTSHHLVDLWRGLAVGSLFLFFSFPTAGRPHSKL